MDQSSQYTLPETGETYSLVSGGSVNSLSVVPGTVVSGAVIEGASEPASGPSWTAIPEYVAVPGAEIVSSGAGTIDTTITGTAFAGGGGMISEQTYSVASATQTILSGGFASNTTLGPLAYSTVENGGVSYDVKIAGGWLSAGRIMPSYNDPTASTFAYYGAEQSVAVGGQVHTATVGQTYMPGASGSLVIDGGRADHVTVFSNGNVRLTSGSLSDVALSGGTLSVVSGQSVHNIVSDGGSIILDKDSKITGVLNVTDNTVIEFLNGGADVSAISAVRKSDENGSDVVLEIQSAGIVINTIPVADDFSNPFYFQTLPSGGGLDLIIGTPCYCPGTLIATSAGETPVEELKIGDLVLTASGVERPIRWLGRRAYDPIFSFGNRDVLPIFFQAGSLGNGLPRRDLTVSPLHAMMIDGYLIPAFHLINDLSITQIQKPKEISYIHIELETHDILLAEGAPSESFVDDGSRGMFHNVAEYDALYPHALKVPARYCAPRLEKGEKLAQIHERLRCLAESERNTLVA